MIRSFLLIQETRGEEEEEEEPQTVLLEAEHDDN
jgi:hypothetical protein